MLVLTRKIGEGIVIGDDVTISVVEIKGNSVRIGINAPKSRKIHRHEVYNRIVQENREAAHWDLTTLNIISENLKSLKKEK